MSYPLINNAFDDPLATRCGHNFEASECPYRHCGYKALLQIAKGNPRWNPDIEAEKILELFMNANLAFERGDDVNQMLSFGEATKQMQAYFYKRKTFTAENNKLPNSKGQNP